MNIIQIRKEKSVPPPVIVSVCGLKHSGKTSVGRLLSELFSFEFFDTDELLAIESMNLTEHMPQKAPQNSLKKLSQKDAVRSLYSMLGNKAFHELELICTRRTVQTCRENDRSSVVAFGGGVSDSSELMNYISENSILIHLHVPEHILFRRIASGGIPPFLDSKHPEDSFHALYERRTAVYRKYMDIEFSHADESLEDVIKFLENNGLKQMIEGYYGRK